MPKSREKILESYGIAKGQPKYKVLKKLYNNPEKGFEKSELEEEFDQNLTLDLQDLEENGWIKEVDGLYVFEKLHKDILELIEE